MVSKYPSLVRVYGEDIVQEALYRVWRARPGVLFLDSNLALHYLSKTCANLRRREKLRDHHRQVATQAYCDTKATAPDTATVLECAELMTRWLRESDTIYRTAQSANARMAALSRLRATFGEIRPR